ENLSISACIERSGNDASADRTCLRRIGVIVGHMAPKHEPYRTMPRHELDHSRAVFEEGIESIVPRCGWRARREILLDCSRAILEPGTPRHVSARHPKRTARHRGRTAVELCLLDDERFQPRPRRSDRSTQAPRPATHDDEIERARGARSDQAKIVGG